MKLIRENKNYKCNNMYMKGVQGYEYRGNG